MINFFLSIFVTLTKDISHDGTHLIKIFSDLPMGHVYHRPTVRPLGLEYPPNAFLENIITFGCGDIPFNPIGLSQRIVKTCIMSLATLVAH